MLLQTAEKSGIPVSEESKSNKADSPAKKKRKIDGDEEFNSKTEHVYPCDNCEFADNSQSSLKKHKQSQHEGIKFPCDQCEYAATDQDSQQLHT